MYPVVVDRDDEAPVASQQHLAELRQLRGAVVDLEAQIRDLESQLAAILKTRDLPRPDADASTRRTESVIAGPPPAGGTTALLKRTAKRALRGSLGVARMVWGAADPAQRHVVAARFVAEPASRLPHLTVVVEGAEIPADLVQQTLEDLEVAVWDRAEGTLAALTLDGVETTRATVRDREDMLSVISGDYIMTLPPSAPALSSSLMERLQWLVASEGPRYVRVIDGGEDPEPQNGSVLMLCSRDVWDPESSPALDRLEEIAQSQPLLGLTAGLAGGLDAVVPRLGSLGVGSHGVVCRTGRFDVWAGNRAGPIEHIVRTLPVASAAAVEGDDRPTVVMVAAAPLEAGYDQLAAGVLAGLADDVLMVVATIAADHSLSLRRASQLERAGVLVYELGSVLDPSVWSSALDRLVGRFDPSVVLTLGFDHRLHGAWSTLEARGVRLLHLGRDGGEGARIPPGWPPVEVPDEISPNRLLEVRGEIGVPVDRFLVVTAADLVARTRPEDVVLVADRLRDEEGLEFLLVGEGPLEGHLVDLMRYLGRVNVRLRRPRHSLHELIAAADLVLDPSEDVVVRPAVVTAAAVGTPVVTTPGGGVEALFPTAGPAGVVVGEVGDPEALAKAVRDVRRRGWTVIDPEPARDEIRSLAAAGLDYLRNAVLDARSTDDRS